MSTLTEPEKQENQVIPNDQLEKDFAAPSASYPNGHPSLNGGSPISANDLKNQEKSGVSQNGRQGDKKDSFVKSSLDDLKAGASGPAATTKRLFKTVFGSKKGVAGTTLSITIIVVSFLAFGISLGHLR